MSKFLETQGKVLKNGLILDSVHTKRWSWTNVWKRAIISFQNKRPSVKTMYLFQKALNKVQCSIPSFNFSAPKQDKVEKISKMQFISREPCSIK